MKFTTELPTEAGIYAWRWRENDSIDLTWVTQGNNGTLWRDLGKYPATNGFWCRLVPADEVVLKEEIETAYCEGWLEGHGPVNLDSGRDAQQDDWEASRAKRVMEGRE